MTNVHKLEQYRPAEFDYEGEHIVIEYRPSTKDYVYHFSITRKLGYDGHASSYDSCVKDAKMRVDQLLGRG